MKIGLTEARIQVNFSISAFRLFVLSSFHPGSSVGATPSWPRMGIQVGGAAFKAVRLIGAPFDPLISSISSRWLLDSIIGIDGGFLGISRNFKEFLDISRNFYHGFPLRDRP